MRRISLCFFHSVTSILVLCVLLVSSWPLTLLSENHHWRKNTNIIFLAISLAFMLPAEEVAEQVAEEVAEEESELPSELPEQEVPPIPIFTATKQADDPLPST